MSERKCTFCHGKGRIFCSRCEGTRRLCGDLCYNCSDGTEECPVCGGSGKVPAF